MKKFSKVLSIFLAALTALSFSALCAPVADAPQAVPLSQFLTDAGTLLQADKKFFEKHGEVAAAGEDEPLRLIVRADGAFDPRGAVAQAGPFDGVSVLQYETAADMKLAKAALEKTAGVEWVCADTAVQAMGNPIAEAIPGIAADGSKHFSWGAAYMGVDDYYDAVGTQGSTVTVAVIDTGIDLDHQSFSEAGFEYSLAQNAAAAGKSVEEYKASLNLLGKLGLGRSEQLPPVSGLVISELCRQLKP